MVFSMRMRNRSTRSNQEILDLILYVRRFAKCSDHVKIAVADHDLGGSDGFTKKFKDPSAMIEVEVKIYMDAVFPASTQYKPQLPVTTFRNWKDHFVCTLGHELHHAWQFENQETSGWTALRKAASAAERDALYDKSEIEAESEGIRILKEYQYDTLGK